AALALLSGQPGGPQQFPAVVATAIGAVLWTVSAAVVGGFAAGERQTVRAGRARRAVAGGALVIVGALAILAGMRMFELRSVVTETTEGIRTDPLALLALGAALMLGGVAVLVLLAPATRIVEALAARTPGLGLPLAARQTARRLPALATLALLVSLAAASVTVASAFSGTAREQRWADARLAAGSDVRLVMSSSLGAGTDLSTTPDLAPLQEIEGVSAAVAVRTATVPIGDTNADLVAVPIQSLDAVAAGGVDPLGGTDPTLLQRGDAQTLIPEGAETFEIRVPVRLATIEGHTDTEHTIEFDPSGTVRLLTPDGGVVPVAVEGQRTTIGHEWVEVVFQGETPPTASRLVVADLDLVGVEPLRNNSLIIEEQGIVSPEMSDEEFNDAFAEAYMELASDGIPDTTSSFVLAIGDAGVWADGGLLSPAPPTIPEPRLPAESSFTEEDELQVWSAFGQWMATGALTELPYVTEAGATSPVPVLVTEPLAAALDLREGSTLGLALDGPTMDVQVAGIVDGVLGARGEQAVLADLPTLSSHLSATRGVVNGPNEVWLATEGDLDAVGESALAVADELGLPEPTLTLARPSAADATEPIRATFWLAAAGAGALALVGAGAAAAAQGLGREGELGVLRALGRSGRASAAARVAELAAIALPSLVLGVALGWAVSALYVPMLSRTATGGAVPAALVLDWPTMAAALVVLLAGLALIGVLVAGAVRRRMARVGVAA
ncbi:MAG: FtsX-like permease family protein, partial [bacterium]|nr:FtsX-like permease family protein [bacterium]